MIVRIALVCGLLCTAFLGWFVVQQEPVSKDLSPVKESMVTSTIEVKETEMPKHFPLDESVDLEGRVMHDVQRQVMAESRARSETEVVEAGSGATADIDLVIEDLEWNEDTVDGLVELFDENEQEAVRSVLTDFVAEERASDL